MMEIKRDTYSSALTKLDMVTVEIVLQEEISVLFRKPVLGINNNFSACVLRYTSF